MRPTAREWLGAGLLILVLVALIVVIVAAGALSVAWFEVYKVVRRLRDRSTVGSGSDS